MIDLSVMSQMGMMRPCQSPAVVAHGPGHSILHGILTGQGYKYGYTAPVQAPSSAQPTKHSNSSQHCPSLRWGSSHKKCYACPGFFFSTVYAIYILNLHPSKQFTPLIIPRRSIPFWDCVFSIGHNLQLNNFALLHTGHYWLYICFCFFQRSMQFKSQIYNQLHPAIKCTPLIIPKRSISFWFYAFSFGHNLQL